MHALHASLRKTCEPHGMNRLQRHVWAATSAITSPERSSPHNASLLARIRCDKGESDASSSEDDKGKRVATPNGVLSSVSTAGPVNNRIRTWFRTGGGDEDAVGATQLRRNEAANLLSKIKETVGEEAYLVLAKSLKAYYAHSDSSLTEVKNTAADIMKAHPDLLKTFEHFLPREIRS